MWRWPARRVDRRVAQRGNLGAGAAALVLSALLAGVLPSAANGQSPFPLVTDPQPETLPGSPLVGQPQGNLGAAADRVITQFDGEAPVDPWGLSADVLWLQRSNGTNNLLGGLVAPNGDVVDQLTAGDARFQFRPGTRITLSRNFDDQVSWQATFFGLQNWTTGRTIYADPFGTGNLLYSPYTQTDALIGGFGTSLGYTYKSRFGSLEFNRIRWREDTGDWNWGTLLGLRYMQLNETLNLNGVDNYYPAYENIDVRSDNYLFGGQAGALLQRNWGQVHWQFIGKAGLLANVVRMRESNLNSSAYQTGSPAGFYGFVYRGTASNVAGVLDGGTTLTWQFRPYASLRLGYQWLYVGGVAFAPGQLDAREHLGGLFMHGPSLGAEMTW